MLMKIMEEKKKAIYRAETILIIFCTICCLVVLCFFNFCGFATFCNSDTYADCQVAIRMWEQKTLFPQGWTFGNQYYVIATPVLAAGLYGLIGDINIAMPLATFIMTVLIFTSLIWMIKSFSSDIREIAFGCFLLPISVICVWGPSSLHSLLFFSQASFYACYLITLFVVFGDYARSFHSDKARPAAWGVSMLLCFATGMQSLRQTAIMILPILAYELFYRMRMVITKQGKWTDNLRTLIRAISYAAANIFGVVLMKLFNIPSAPIYENDITASSEYWLQQIKTIGNALIEITSLDYILRGDFGKVLAVQIILMIILVLTAGVLWCSRIFRQENGLELCWFLFLIGIFGICLASITVGVTLRSIYLFMWFPMAALSGLIVIRKVPNIVRCGIFVVVCAVGVLSVLYGYQPYMHIIADEMSYEVQLSQWACDNGYEYIYGEYWGTAPQIAVHSHGDLEAGCWHAVDNLFWVELSNTPQDIYGAEQNEKAIYVFNGAEEEKRALILAEERGAILRKMIEFGDFEVYTASEPLMRLRR